MRSKKKSRRLHHHRHRRQYHVIDPAMADFLYEDIENIPDFLGDLQLWFSNIYDRTARAVNDFQDVPPEPMGEFDNEFLQNARSRHSSNIRRSPPAT